MKNVIHSAGLPLSFSSKRKDVDFIKVRAFDACTFVAFGAAHLGVVGDDVLKEFNYDEVNNVMDLGIGKCKLSVAHKKDLLKKKERNGHLMIATKYKNTVTDYFASKGIRAECIKLIPSCCPLRVKKGLYTLNPLT